MAQMHRVRTGMTGKPGSPGVATMYFYNLNTALASVRAFWVAVAPIMPTGLSLQVESVGDIIDDATGDLVGAFSKPAVAPVVATGAGVYAAPVGAVINWHTETIADSHRVRGKTFIVPLHGEAFDIDGSLAATTVGYLAAAAQALQFEQSLDFVVWHRPYAGRAATPTLPAKLAHLGSSALVTSSSVPDKAVVLRSRRD